MKCYYEVLALPLNASESDIKSSYRKLALRWHPDKNPDRLEEAKNQFLLIQQAYEVLADPQERAFYDNHREQILRGKNSNYEENCLNVFQYFTSSCFKGHGDDDNGFYNVYSGVFEKIAAEDTEFMDDEEDILSIPKFGNSSSSYDEIVGPFYAYWQSYCTKKTYTWLCPYDITEIKDRRIIRKIEKDMKKVVQKAKRERNEEVRNLVSFVRKRDKRVQAHKKLLEERAALNREKQERNRIEQIRKRNREVEEMRKSNGHAFSDGYEEQLKQLEQEYGIEHCEEESEGECEGEDLDEIVGKTQSLGLEDYVEDLYCVACNRSFKNENAFLNHETSKKHRENLEQLKCQMQEEEEEAAIVDADAGEGKNDSEYQASSAEASSDDENSQVENQNFLQMEYCSKQKRKKNKKAKKSRVTNRSESDEKKVTVESLAAVDTECTDEWDETSKKVARKSKNKKLKKSIELKVTKETKEIESNVKDPLREEASTTVHSCATCNSTFESKNKLFLHLKKTNHSVFLPTNAKTTKTVGSSEEPTKNSKTKRNNRK